VGQTPAPLFDATMSPPARLTPGDRVQFQPISAEVHEQLIEAAKEGIDMLQSADA
jgi:allophanate hydrolase subunit 1